MEAASDAEGSRRFEDVARRLREPPVSDVFTPSDPAAETDIETAEAELAIMLPPLYRRFLREFGPAELGVDFLDVTPGSPQSLPAVRARKRKAWPPLPRRLVPFALGSAWVGPMKWGDSFLCFDLSRTTHGGEYRIASWTPQAPPRERLERMDVTFLEWLEGRVSDAERCVSPPRDWKNSDGWERYWARVLDDPMRRGWESRPEPHSAALRHRDFLTDRGLRRILFAGNGISLEPHVFAHCGFDVTAIDVSATASRFVAQSRLSRDQLASVFAAYDEVKSHRDDIKLEINEAHSRERVDREHVPGGRLHAITGDLFTHAPAGAYDVIYSSRALQGFTDQDRLILAHRFFDGLRPGGVALIETINIASMSEFTEDFEGAFREAGFFVHERNANTWLDEKRRARFTRRKDLMEAFRRREAAEWAEHARRLDGGDKMVLFWHSSG